jgi:release factor glutamine methyltransferase
MSTLKQALLDAQAQGLARIDAQLLLLHTLGRDPNDRAWLLAHDTDALTDGQAACFVALCQRRAAREPVAYLTGTKAFYGLPLHVDARVLDPRPDTETLVEWALDVLKNIPRPQVLDLGTGSGAVALALQHQRPDAQVWATDASTDALAVAQANAQRLGLPVRFEAGSWFQPLPVEIRFDAIVSNPPYVATDDPHLSALTHEPLSALASGPDGLDDIRTIVAQAGQHLVHGGWLLLEHGHDQGAAVRALLAQAGFSAVSTRTDLAGLDRCSGGQWGGRG